MHFYNYCASFDDDVGIYLFKSNIILKYTDIFRDNIKLISTCNRN